jgi:ATP-dependent DNA helicase RecG
MDTKQQPIIDSNFFSEPEIPATRLVKGRLSSCGYDHIFDLLLLLPLRYEDRTSIIPIKDLSRKIGCRVLVQGKITHHYFSKHPKARLQLVLSDQDEDSLHIRFLHVYPKQELIYTVGTHWQFFGEIRSGYHGLEMIHPQSTKILPNSPPPLADKLLAIYPKLKGIAASTHRKIIEHIFDHQLIEDLIPEWLRKSFVDISLNDALQNIHQPSLTKHEEFDPKHLAWQRLVFDELLAHQWIMAKQKQGLFQYTTSCTIGSNRYLCDRLIQSLPFDLTSGQSRSIEDIHQDLQKTTPMQRLLQGDVGCGKTIVAACASLLIIEHKQQVALMVPTEVLAMQHSRKFQEWFIPLGVSVYLLLGSQKKSERKKVLAALETKEACIVIGTHALFQDSVSFLSLGLVIMDEQHRFGVEQRLSLRNKGISPHVLMMSATPIPRTLAMSYFADLDVSTIDTLPNNRSPIRTRLVQKSRLNEVLGFVEKICSQGHQVYWVCPLIEDSEHLSLQNLMNAKDIISQLLPHRRLSVIHGKMKSEEKQNVMEDFIAHKSDILLATTVIEVGVDVANACLMVIEHPERMGLAQLHQLRGRVGRGIHAGECILFYDVPLSEQGKSRLKIMYEHTDGFEIAKQDLLLRGPGELLGVRQSGIPQLRFAHIEHDQEMLCKIQDLLQKHPNLINESFMHRHAMRWYKQSMPQV